MQPRGVVVLGMHRSGTSAVAGVVNRLGVPPITDDLVPADAANPRGYWESERLQVFNDELLAAVRRSWKLPPRAPLDWEGEERVAPLRRLAAARFRTDFARPEWIWKDPRAVLTLPFWLAAFEFEPTLVLVHRDPLEVADSLARRDGFEPRRGLALWERYVRHSLALARGRAVLVTRYVELLQDPEGWAARLAGFLRGRGFAVQDPGPAGEFVDPALRRARGTGELSPEQAELAAVLARLEGEHGQLELPALAPETEWVEDVLVESEVGELRGRAERAERAVADYAGSRSYRATAPARWVASRAAGLLQSARRATAQ